MQVFDEDGGFATGGGWIEIQPQGEGDPSKANFRFNAKYKNGQPEGHLTIKYKDDNIDLKSTRIDWLVINTMSAQFQGTGTMKDIPKTNFRVLLGFICL